MTPAEIRQKREDIARAICARNIKARACSDEVLIITERDLKNVPARALKRMIKLITPKGQ